MSRCRCNCPIHSFLLLCNDDPNSMCRLCMLDVVYDAIEDGCINSSVMKYYYIHVYNYAECVILLQGTLGETLKEVQPTIFFGVPRCAVIISEPTMIYTH